MYKSVLEVYRADTSKVRASAAVSGGCRCCYCHCVTRQAEPGLTVEGQSEEPSECTPVRGATQGGWQEGGDVVMWSSVMCGFNIVVVCSFIRFFGRCSWFLMWS